MLSDSRQYLVNAPWMMFVPAGAICMSVISLNLIGDGVAELSRRRARAVEV
jgi:peptide/nickel transport system permease protein